MKQGKWKTSFSILIVIIMLIVQGCKGSSYSSEENQQTQETIAPASNSSTAPVTVTWWHSMGNELGKIDLIVNNFNASQSEIHVNHAYKGTYEELLGKVSASLNSNSGPSFIQVYDAGTRYMLDSKAITPIQAFINQDNYDTSDLEEQFLNYYTIDDELYAMPFNMQTPVMYYNKDLFIEAGLDPEKPPATFDELTKMAKALQKNGVTGLSFYIEPWLMEQFFALQEAEYVNNNNGRSGLATESYLNKEAGVKTLTWWKSLVDDKLALNFGSNPNEAINAFLEGQTAMFINSTVSLRGIVDAVEGKFEVGTGYLPNPDSSKEGGIVVRGTSNWIMNNKSQKEQQAAWEFIKYFSSPKVQAYWYNITGYYPITKKAFEEQNVKDLLNKYPYFKTAIEQLHQSKTTYATQGALIGVFKESREFVSKAIEEALIGSSTPQEALNTAAENITIAIIKYNQTVK